MNKVYRSRLMKRLCAKRFVKVKLLSIRTILLLLIQNVRVNDVKRHETYA